MMAMKPHYSLHLIALLAVGLSPLARAADLRIPLPKRSKSTPVQELNREGVEAVRKNQVEKARALFYKAYLFDPNDPFTLNNLGYVSELEGQVDRAHQFYALAAEAPTDAVIDRASTGSVEGQTVAEAARNIPEKNIQVNRDNVEAIRLLAQGRAPEADLLLRRTLNLEPGNPFTLNNYAVVKEMEGDFDEALKYYSAAAKSGSEEPVVVTLNTNWRGKPVSEMASSNVKRMRERMEREQSVVSQVQRLNLQGVSALNRNARYDGRRLFEQAYKLDPENAFVLNNRGYVSEMDGDTESAAFFYEKARQSGQANTRVGFATRQLDEGKKLFEVAGQNSEKMEGKMAAAQESRRRQSTPVQLKHRDNTPVEHNDTAPPSQPAESPTLGPPQPPVPQLNPSPQR